MRPVSRLPASGITASGDQSDKDMPAKVGRFVCSTRSCTATVGERKFSTILTFQGSGAMLLWFGEDQVITVQGSGAARQCFGEKVSIKS